MILLVIGIIVAFLLWYALRGRAWLKEKPWAWSRRMFDLIEPIEIALWKKSETMLIARLLWLGGAIVTSYDFIAVFAASLDLTPITSRLLADVPQDMRGIVVSATLSGLGLLIGWLRKRTSKPLEVVELPNEVPPAVADALAKADEAKVEAVAAAATVPDVPAGAPLVKVE